MEASKSSYFPWYASLFHAFADRLDGGDGGAPLEDIARVTRLLEAAYGSHANGRRVAL